jgi:hypothetical protein
MITNDAAKASESKEIQRLKVCFCSVVHAIPARCVFLAVEDSERVLLECLTPLLTTPPAPACRTSSQSSRPDRLLKMNTDALQLHRSFFGTVIFSSPRLRQAAHGSTRALMNCSALIR